MFPNKVLKMNPVSDSAGLKGDSNIGLAQEGPRDPPGRRQGR